MLPTLLLANNRSVWREQPLTCSHTLHSEHYSHESTGANDLFGWRPFLHYVLCAGRLRAA